MIRSTKNKEKAPRAIHINELRRTLDVCRIDRARVDVECWAMDGRILHYKDWLVKSGSWRQGTHNLLNPLNGQVRKVRDVFIFRLNGHPVYL